MRLMGVAVLVTAGVLVSAGQSWAAPAPGFTELVSVSSGGVQGDQDSELPSVSADGRFVAFVSFAESLVPGDTNQTADIFVRDRLLGTTERVSVSSRGVEGDGPSGLLDLMGGPSISGDGRYVAFSSEATNLVRGDRNGIADVFVHDRTTGQTTLESTVADGGTEPDLSRDGSVVAFVSFNDVFARDRGTGIVQRISQAPDSSDANSQSFAPRVNADGRFVYFTSFASNLVDGDADNGDIDAYLFDRASGEMTAVTSSRPSSGVITHGRAEGISGTGRFLTFTTQDTTFADPDANGFFEDAWLVDRTTGQYTLVGVNDAGEQGDDSTFAGDVSDDGRFVALVSRATNFGGPDNFRENVYLRDRAAGTTRLVSVATDGTEGDLDSLQPSLTPDGAVAAFASRSSTFVAEDQGFFAYDVFVRDMRAQAGLAVTQADSPDPATARGQVTYTVTVRNGGPAAATGVTLVDTLPENAVFVSASAGCAPPGRKSTVAQCDLGTLAAGASATVTIVVSPPRAGTLTNTATVRADQPDGDPGDNTSTETTTVQPR